MVAFCPSLTEATCASNGGSNCNWVELVTADGTVWTTKIGFDYNEQANDI